MITIKQFTIEDSDTYQQSLEIRDEVFVIEQGVSPELEIDEYEADAIYYLLFEGDEPVATARYRETSEGVKLERFAVLQEYRHNGYAGEILNHILADLKEENKPIYLHAQEQVISFYERFGFKKVGTRFFEAGIPHFKMIQHH